MFKLYHLRLGLPLLPRRACTELAEVLALLDTFRTLNWTSIKNEIQFSGILDHLRMTVINN